MDLVESGGINPIYHLNRAPAQSGKNDFLLLASLTKGDVNLGLNTQELLSEKYYV